MAVPYLNLKEVNNHLLEDFQEQIAKIFESGQFVLGPAVQKFEEQLARYASVRHAVGVNSGSDAVLLALKGLGVGPGDEVICPAYAPAPCAAAILNVGATPIFVDVRPDTMCIDPDLCLHAINARTKAILALHLFGHAAEIDRLVTIARTYSVAVIEDMRHATGGRFNTRRLGSFGNYSCFSFYPTRNLGCAGDGGAVATSDDKLAERIRHLRDRDWSINGDTDLTCFDSRLDAIQAAVLSIKLQELDDNNLERVENARLYNQLFADSPVTTPPFRDDLNHVYNQYTVLCPDRDKLAEHLESKGIGFKVYYSTPLHLHPICNAFEYKEGAFPTTEDLSRRTLSLPIAPGLKKKHIEEVVSVVKDFYGVTA